MRSLCFAALLILAAAPPAIAQQKPNTLTPQEVAQGWILLFDGETSFGWNIDGEAKLVDGALVLGGERATTAVLTTACGPEFECQFERRAEGKPALLSVDRGVQHGVGGGQAEWRTQRVRSWYEDGKRRVESAIEGGRSASSVSGPPRAAALSFEVPPGSHLSLREIKLRPLGMKPLFNGKDLTGWHVFPGAKYKSKFAVVDGALHVKDGPGDLQTEGKYGDFLLQLECKSNGKHLNSGLFFRCRPGEYQNGYEAQINNNFAAAPKEYTVEEYDPQTHKLLGKKKVASNAVDFGTGAIYRRVPARKPMAKDGEWFTLTVVAHGNHLATWVNGVQEVDWNDNRPPSDNARTGYRPEAGHLSIQGHDPTTDLSFRNLRIAALPASKNP